MTLISEVRIDLGKKTRINGGSISNTIKSSFVHTYFMGENIKIFWNLRFYIILIDETV